MIALLTDCLGWVFCVVFAVCIECLGLTLVLGWFACGSCVTSAFCCVSFASFVWIIR